jgi:predicted glycoside hydrolase/deacetylase ChbG (UPF0249 family)
MPDQCKVPRFIVVNADDFGYFACVSRGIVECVRKGAVTATGVMANGPRFNEIINWLHDLPQIDVGVHLNLTYGRPLSPVCRRYLKPFGGFFVPRFKTAGMILQKRLPVSVIKSEWRTQIERCLNAGLTIRFLNSHEHIQILPGLTDVMLKLAREYRIENIRLPLPEWRVWPASFSAVIRNLLLYAATNLNGTFRLQNPIRVFGIGVSGKLTLEYLYRLFTSLVPGGVYELMCHPGFCDPDEIQDHRLCRFHSWQQELDLLTGRALKDLLQRCHITPQRFRDIHGAHPAEARFEA